MTHAPNTRALFLDLKKITAGKTLADGIVPTAYPSTYKTALGPTMPGRGFTIAIGAVVAATFSVNAAAQPPDISSLSASVAFPVSWGTQITWTATASGGTAPLQYQFWRLRQGVGWTLA